MTRRLVCGYGLGPTSYPTVGRGRPIIVDYKTAASANPRRFAKSVAEYGYHQQAAWYIDGLEQITGAADAAFLFVVQQKDPPWLVSVCQLDRKTSNSAAGKTGWASKHTRRAVSRGLAGL